jgi:ATP-binding cassette, subfamily B, bacterial
VTQSFSPAQPNGPIRDLIRIARPYRRDYLVAMGAFFLKDSPAWILPAITAIVIDTVVAGGPVSTLWILGLVALLVLLQNYPMHLVFIRRSSKATRSIAYILRTSLAEHLQKISMNFHNRVGGSVIQSKIVRDVENVELMIQQSLPIALSGTFSLIGALVVIAFNVPLFLIVFGLVIPLGVMLVASFRKLSSSQNEQFRSQVEQFSSQVAEVSSLLPVVRAHAIEETAKQMVNQSADQLRQKGVALDSLNGKFGALAWISYQLLGVASLLLAASLAVLGLIDITAGQVVLVATYFAVLMGTAIGLLNILPSLAKGIESLRSIQEILSSEDLEHNDGKPGLASISGELRIENLRVELGGKTVIESINLSIPKKSSVAFVGPSGSGKTTLVHTLMGLVRPVSGEVFYDQVAMSEVDMRTVRRHVSYVPQESVVLDGSVRDNISLGLNAKDEKILEVLALANLHDLAKQPSDLDQIIGRSGIRLSVGQRQRLAIARALYRDPKVLVLDEATSALDMESERFIQGTLSKLSKQLTIITVAHRLATVQAADTICFLSQGKIVEIGNHEKLMNLRGSYYQMVVGNEIA